MIDSSNGELLERINLVPFRLSFSVVRLVSVLDLRVLEFVARASTTYISELLTLNSREQLQRLSSKPLYPLERYWCRWDQFTRVLDDLYSDDLTETLQPRKLVSYTRRLMAEDFGML